MKTEHPVSAGVSEDTCLALVHAASGRCPLTNLSRGDDILVFGVLVDSQAEDVVGVLQVEALGSCQHRFLCQEKLGAKVKMKSGK